jgi:putative ABC transport system substrate-binding protein
VGSFDAQWPYPLGRSRAEVFEEELRRLGYEPGISVQIEYRFAGGDFELLPDLAADLVALNVNAILLADSSAISPVRRATSEIPIIMTISIDAVQTGLVESLSKPGGNLTGQTISTLELVEKRLQLMRQTLPDARKLGVLWRESRFTRLEWDYVEEAARPLGIQLVSLPFEGPGQIEQTMERARRDTDAVLVLGAPVINAHNVEIATAAAVKTLPLVGANTDWVRAGALMAFTPNYDDVFQRATAQLVRILRGARPEDTPVELPRCYDLGLNLAAARDLSLGEIPREVRSQITQVFGAEGSERPLQEIAERRDLQCGR